MSLLGELRRRNVIRVALAYAVMTWLVLQVADVVLNNIDAPGWVFWTILLALGIGFPFVLVFSWVFEFTSEGLKRERELDREASVTRQTSRRLDRAIIVALVLAAGYFFWESRVADKPTGTLAGTEVAATGPGAKPHAGRATADPGTVDGAPVGAVVSSRSVAILPFVNMSPDPDKEYFSDGITEEIINAVVKIPGVSVPARTTVFGYKGQQGDVRAIGHELGVAHVLEGSVRAQGDQVRITAQMIKVDDGFHLWSETYDRRLENIFQVQEEIADAIAAQLVGALADVTTVPNRTGNMEAYDTYLRGRAALRERDDSAIELLAQSTEIDPGFAPAWAALAVAYQSEGDQDAAARAAAGRALELDPDNVDALTALGAAHRSAFRWAEAERTFERALAIDPNSVELLEDYAEFLNYVGRTDDALAITTRGVELDPQHGPMFSAHLEALLSSGQRDRAHELATARLTGDESTGWNWINAFPVWLAPDARGELLPVPPMPPPSDGQPEPFLQLRSDLARVLAAPDPEAMERLKQRKGDFERASLFIWSRVIRPVLVHRGQADFVMRSDLARFGTDPFGLNEWTWTPMYRPLREHPLFPELMKRAGLVAYWDATEWPEWCARDQTGEVHCR